ncbi:MAG: hypothetical protein U5L01_00165 [Rheinheimera sp.]|nr:hypothetical protein [Rheinheimera sp.]
MKSRLRLQLLNTAAPAAGDAAATADGKPADAAGSEADPSVGTALYVGMPRPFVLMCQVPGVNG